MQINYTVTSALPEAMRKALSTASGDDSCLSALYSTDSDSSIADSSNYTFCGVCRTAVLEFAAFEGIPSSEDLEKAVVSLDRNITNVKLVSPFAVYNSLFQTRRVRYD